MFSTLMEAMKQKTHVEFAMLTDVGRSRAHNEDACAADESAGVFVVCDGMGGAAGGEIASRMASRVFLEHARIHRRVPPETRLEDAANEANRAVFAESLRDTSLRGMGTTLVGLYLEEANRQIHIVNVGDSRCYRFREDALQQLTSDHSFVDEQVKLGIMSQDEASASHLRNIITRAIGSHVQVTPDVETHTTHPGDTFLLCSDGLTRELDDAEIAAVLREGRTYDLQTCARALINLANDYGGQDNITVILVRV